MDAEIGGLTMYDELVKKLRHCGNTISCLYCLYWDGCGGSKEGCGGSKEDLTQAANAIEELSHDIDIMNAANIALYGALPRWIPVTERLPEHSYGESNSVLTVSSLGTMRVLYFDGGNWCYPTGEALTTAGKFPVTHWMPLPQPPKET